MQVYSARDLLPRLKKKALARAQRICLGLAPDAPAGGRFSAVHWHPDYARAYPKGMGRMPVLLEPKEAARYVYTDRLTRSDIHIHNSQAHRHIHKLTRSDIHTNSQAHTERYRQIRHAYIHIHTHAVTQTINQPRYKMITQFNKVTDAYDGTPKVMAIPNYLGIIRGSYVYDDIRVRGPPSGSQSLGSSRIEKWTMQNNRSFVPPLLPLVVPPITSIAKVSDPPVDITSPSPPPATSSDVCEPLRANVFSPDIQNGALDGAKKCEFTGMRAELTSKYWFDDDPRAKENRRLFSWYGYHGGNMNWRMLMTLIVKVHWPDEPDMKLPTEAERNRRCRGVRFTNLEKCLITKLYLTTGLGMNKIADLWGCSARTISSAIRYWRPRWKETARRYIRTYTSCKHAHVYTSCKHTRARTHYSFRYCRLRVWSGYLRACQPAGWNRRYKRDISHLTDGG